MQVLGRVFLVCAVSVMLGGCRGTEGTQQAADPVGGEKIQIGMVFDNFVMERWQRDRDVFVSTAKELGAEVNVQNANGSVEEQQELMEYFIRKQVDVIVIVPVDSEPLLDSIRKAQGNGIKVICYDRLVVGAEPDLYISFDNTQVGSLMGEALVSRLNAEDKVLMICGPVTDHNVTEVQAGFRETMEKGNIEILDIHYVEEWKPEYAEAYVRQNSTLLGEVKGIMCGNDNLAGKTVSVLAEQRLAGDILVTGQDADLAACQRIVEGTQYMTVYKPIEKMAACTAQAAVTLAENGALDTDVYTAADGTQIPYIKMEPVSVTAQNIQEVIIDSGFHLKADVYLNRPDLLE